MALDPRLRAPVWLGIALGLLAHAADARPRSDELSAPGAAAGLTEDDAVALALQRAPELALARAERAVEVATPDRAGRVSDPELRLADLRRADPLTGAPSWGASVRIPLPTFGAVRARTTLVDARARASQLEVDATAWDVEVEVRARFASLAVQGERIAQLEAIAAAQDERAAALRAQGEAGAATALTLALAEVDVQEARSRAQAAWEERRQALMELALLLGADPASPPALALPPATLPGGELDVAALVEAALAGHPALRADAARVEEAALKASIQRAARLPYLSFVEVGYDPAGPLGSGADGQWSARLAVGLPPIFQSGHAALAASAEEALARETLAADQAALEAKVRSLAGEAQALRRGDTQAQALAAAVAEALTQLEALVRAGERERVDLAELRIRQAEVALRRLEGVQRSVDVRAALQGAVGGPLP